MRSDHRERDVRGRVLSKDRKLCLLRIMRRVLQSGGQFYEEKRPTRFHADITRPAYPSTVSTKHIRTLYKIYT